MDTESLTYAEIADRFELPSIAAAKARTRRAGWMRTASNDGTTRVAVPVDAMNDPRRHRQRPRHGSAPPTHPAPLPPAPSGEALDAIRIAYEAALAQQRTGYEARILQLQAWIAAAEAAAERVNAEAQRSAAALTAAVAARDAAETEAAAWMAGGPLTRAWRAFAWRRG